MAVTLTFEDDDTLFVAASGLAVIADRIESGEEIPQLANLIRAAGMMIAQVMADAYDRAVDSELNLN